jgi:hypothetical protein
MTKVRESRCYGAAGMCESRDAKSKTNSIDAGIDGLRRQERVNAGGAV